MKSVSGKKFTKILEKKGWVLLRINGSHHIYGKKDVTSKLSIPIHGNKPLKIGLLRYFMKVANISESEL